MVTSTISTSPAKRWEIDRLRPSRDPRGSPETRKQQILAAAAERFAERGFHGVSIDELGAATGITGPALYRYFSSKEAVLAELLVGISEVLVQEAEACVASVSRSSPASASASDSGSEDTVLELIRSHVRFALDHPELIRIHNRDLMSLRKTERDRVRRLQRRYIEIWVAALRRAQKSLDRQSALIRVRAVFGLINSTPYITASSRPRVEHELELMALAAFDASTAVDACTPYSARLSGTSR